MAGKVERGPPLLTCDARLAAFLGAVAIRGPAQQSRSEQPCIAVRARDGTCWSWPLEAGFRAAIMRR